MICIKRTFQQILGGAPFIVSGACGMFRADVLREVGLTDRTNVEDLDLTWSLIAGGYKVRQTNRCVVYPQECMTLRGMEALAALDHGLCRLHAPALAAVFTRYGVFQHSADVLVVVLGLALIRHQLGPGHCSGQADSCHR